MNDSGEHRWCAQISDIERTVLAEPANRAALADALDVAASITLRLAGAQSGSRRDTAGAFVKIELARAELNQAIGLPWSTHSLLVTDLPPLPHDQLCADTRRLLQAAADALRTCHQQPNVALAYANAIVSLDHAAERLSEHPA